MKHKGLIAVGAGLLLMLAVSPFLVSVGEDVFFRPPATAKAATADQLRFDHQDQLTAKVTHEFLQLGGERIAISRVTPENVTSSTPLIVHCGGNATDRFTTGVYYSKKILPWGEPLFFDYPGYGDSSGKVSVKAFNAVLAEFGPWIDAQAKGRPLVLWGHSIGGLMCAKLATQSREVDAIVLETTGPSPTAIATDRVKFIPYYTVRVRGGFEAYDIPGLLKTFPGPILVAGAGKDRTLPVYLSQNLAEALRQEGRDITYVEIPEAVHNGAADTPEFMAAAKPFFALVTDSRH